LLLGVLYAASVAGYRVTCSRLALAASQPRRLAVFLTPPSSRPIETKRDILLRAFAPLQSLARDSTLTLSQLEPRSNLRRPDSRKPTEANFPSATRRKKASDRPKTTFRSPPTRRHASARAHASRGVLYPLRDKSYGSPLGYPDRSLGQDPRQHRPDASCVPPSGFLSLSTDCSSRGPAALFHAAATCRVFPFRGFPSQAASRGSSPRRALLPLHPRLPEACSRNH
jgi:hypothetical protein